MTRTQVCKQNANMFPQDSAWQEHCARMMDYYNSIPPITSKPGFDGRKN